MNYESLVTFVSLAKTKSFTKTAEEVFCTQSTATLRIQSLENTYGVKLFHRTGKSVSLTEAGKILLPHAELILSTCREAEERISQLRNLSSGKIDLISSHTPGTYILPFLLASFRKAYPAIVVNSHIEYASNVIQEIAEGVRFDLGLVSQPKMVEDTRLVCRFIMEDPLALIVSPDHPLAKKKKIDLEALTNEILLISNSSTSLIDYLKSVTNGKAELKKFVVVGNAEAVKKSVKMNLGAAIISKYAIQEEVKNGDLVEVELQGNNLQRNIYLLQRKNRIPSPASEAFIHLLFRKHENDSQHWLETVFAMR